MGPCAIPLTGCRLLPITLKLIVSFFSSFNDFLLPPSPFSHFSIVIVQLKFSFVSRSQRKLDRERNGRLLCTHELLSDLRSTREGPDAARHPHFQQAAKVSPRDQQPATEAHSPHAVRTDRAQTADLATQGRITWFLQGAAEAVEGEL